MIQQYYQQNAQYMTISLSSLQIDRDFTVSLFIIHLLAAFLVLLTAKVFLGIALLFYCDYTQQRDNKLLFKRSHIDYGITNSSHNTNGGSLFEEVGDSKAQDKVIKERLEFIEELSNIERYTVYKGRIL